MSESEIIAVNCPICGKTLVVVDVLRAYEDFALTGICERCLNSVIGNQRGGAISALTDDPAKTDWEFKKIIKQNFK